jgi:hypothetical protein
MKISKISQSLALIPLTGVISIMGTPAAFAMECSSLSPCVVNSVPAVSSLSDVLASPKAQVTVPQVQSLTAPIAPAVDKVTAPVKAVTAPVAGTINKVTATVVDTVGSVATPVAPIAPIIKESIAVIPKAPVPAMEQTVSPAAPVAVATAVDGTNAENVAPENTKSASDTSAAVQLHESSAASSGALNGVATLGPSLLDSKPATVHSSQGSATKVIHSGAFGFGYLNPMDNPVSFTGLVFAYIIVLGSAIGFAVKRSAFLNFGRLA